jgi:hypothetical protein
VTDRPRIPRWSPLYEESLDGKPYDEEEKDAQELSRGTAHRTPGSGRLAQNDLDSVVDDFKTDNKTIVQRPSGHGKGYRVDRDFWLDRRQKASATGHNFREALAFEWEGNGGRQQLRLTIVEDSVFKEIYHGYQDFMDFLQGKKSLEEIIEQYSKAGVKIPDWTRRR